MRKEELLAVREFQKLFDVPLADSGTKISDCPPGAVFLNHRICAEEVKETLTKGVMAGDIIEIADGCADSVYVLAHAINQLGRVPNKGRDAAAKSLLSDALQRVSMAMGNRMPETDEDLDAHLAFVDIVIRGVAAVYDIPLDKVFAEVHRSNMTKVWEDGKGRKDEGGKVIKPPGYEKPDIAAVLRKYAGA